MVREVDFDGRVLRCADALGGVTTFAYDLCGKITEDDASRYSYDAAGRLVHAVDGSVDVSFAYGALVSWPRSSTA